MKKRLLFGLCLASCFIFLGFTLLETEHSNAKQSTVNNHRMAMLSETDLSIANHSTTDRIEAAAIHDESLPAILLELPELNFPAGFVMDESMPCNYRAALAATPGFLDCLNDALIPGYEFEVNINPGAALCGPFGSWQGYIWLSYICPPPCFGPPDILVAEVLMCGNCTVISWNCI